MNQVCRNCRNNFTITERDHNFLSRIAPHIDSTKHNIPAPTLCPQCRWQRRLSFRNERTLYKRKCDLSGRSMISMYPENTPFPVYYVSEWQSDKWNALDYGIDFNFSELFFTQFERLLNKVPHLNLFVDPLADENSEYTNCASWSKNCYLISQAEKNEDCYYSRGINGCRDCCDCLRIHECELCYESINLSGCYNCLYSQDLSNCSDCYFSSELKACKFCFGCYGLTQKEYYIYNKPVSQEEWQRLIASLELSTTNINIFKQRTLETKKNLPQRAIHTHLCEESSGDNIQNCRDSQNCFDSHSLEHCSYCNELSSGNSKYCQDYSMWGQAEVVYECMGCGTDAYHLLFSASCWQGISELIYCMYCVPAVKECFGSIGLKRARNCILNKSYSKIEYERLLSRIINHMKETKEWGEFFPARISPFPYNDSLAQEYFPMQEAETVKAGLRWNKLSSFPKTNHEKLQAIQFPEYINDCNDSICNQIILCELSQKPFKILKPELKLYKKLGVPVPKYAPEQRHLDRVRKQSPRQLLLKICSGCGENTQSCIATENSTLVYCERCFENTK